MALETLAGAGVEMGEKQRENVPWTPESSRVSQESVVPMVTCSLLVKGIKA